MRLLTGDCLALMPTLDTESIDAVVTDPPYGLAFMGRVTPPGGTVLDPFLGSGTTAMACEMEGFDWIGIEREPEYVAIAEARLSLVQRGLGIV